MLDCVIDLSHWNVVKDLRPAAAAGLLGVINKATEGVGTVDPALAQHRLVTRTAGLLPGVYHFGTGEQGGAAQADFFLAHAAPGELLVLDLEPNPDGASMTLGQGADFVARVQARTGVTPVLYGGSALKVPGQAPPAPLTECPLFLSQYGPVPVLPRGWAAWALWQRSNGVVNAPPSPWPGVGPCDRDWFAGDAAALPVFWAAHALPGPAAAA
jgi:lysozyme